MRTRCCLLPVTELSAHLTKLPPVPFPRKAQESQKEMKLLLDMYKSAPKEQRDKVQLMAAERKAKAEVRAGGAQSLAQGLSALSQQACFFSYSLTLQSKLVVMLLCGPVFEGFPPVGAGG